MGRLTLMSKREKPEEIPMTEEELKDLLARIKEKTLQDNDYATLEKLIHFLLSENFFQGFQLPQTLQAKHQFSDNLHSLL